jgi:hypothetical protein
MEEIRYIKKTFEFAEDYVSCENCGRNYSAAHVTRIPVFCQAYTLKIDVYNLKENRKRAEKCECWIPYGIERSRTKSPKVDLWYEKDSIA